MTCLQKPKFRECTAISLLTEHNCPPGQSISSSLVLGWPPCFSLEIITDWQTYSSSIFLNSDCRNSLVSKMEARVPWINSCLKKSRNPGPWLSSSRLWCAGAGLGHRLCQISCPPNLPECAFHFPASVPALSHRRKLREKHFSARLLYMGRVLGLQQLLGVWVALADVRYSSHFINFGNKTPDYSWPKHPFLIDSQCVFHPT